MSASSTLAAATLPEMPPYSRRDLLPHQPENGDGVAHGQNSRSAPPLSRRPDPSRQRPRRADHSRPRRSGSGYGSGACLRRQCGLFFWHCPSPSLASIVARPTVLHRLVLSARRFVLVPAAACIDESVGCPSVIYALFDLALHHMPMGAEWSGDAMYMYTAQCLFMRRSVASSAC